MATEEQITRIKEMEKAVNERFKGEIERQGMITYQEFVDAFVNPYLPEDKQIGKTLDGWVKIDDQPLNLNFDSAQDEDSIVIRFDL